MSLSEASGVCTSTEDALTCSPWTTVDSGHPPAHLSLLDLNSKLGKRTQRRRTSSPFAGRRSILTDSMTSTRKIRVIGRFASPQRSREGTPQLSGDDSSDSEDCSVERTAVHAQIDSDMDDNDANDADDEGDNRKESRGRNRKPRRISLSRAILN